MNRRMLTFSSVLLLSGCSTSINGFYPQATGNVGEGITYYLPMDVIEIKSKITTTTTTTLKFKPSKPLTNDPIQPAKTCFEASPGKPKKQVSVDPVNVATLNDNSHFYSIAIDPSFFSAGELAVTRSANGLLKSITVKDQGRADETAVAGLKAIASITGAVTGLGSVPTPGEVTERFGNSESLKFTPPDTRESTTSETEPEPKKCSAWRVELTQSLSTGLADTPNGGAGSDSAHIRARDLARIALTNYQFTAVDLFTLADTPTSGNVLQRIEYLKAYLELKEGELDELEFILLSSKPAERRDLLPKRRLIEADIERKTDELEQKTKAFSAQLKASRDKMGVGVKTVTKTEEAAFKVSELPSPAEFNAWNSHLSSSASEPWSTFERLNAGFAIQTQTPSGTTVQTDVTKFLGTDKDVADSRKEKWDKDAGYVFYRDPSPYIFRLYVKDVKTSSYKEQQRGVASLFEDSAKPSAIRFEASSMGDRSLAMTFSDKGALTDVKYTYTSAGESAAQAALDGSKGAMAEYKAAIDQAESINASRRAIQVNNLDYQLTLLKKQKEELEAQTALAGAYASADDTLAVTNLNSEITRLEAEKNKVEAMSALDRVAAFESINNRTALAEARNNLLAQQLLLDQSTQTGAISTDQAVLEARQERLNAQLQLFNMQQQLSGANTLAPINSQVSEITALQGLYALQNSNTQIQNGQATQNETALLQLQIDLLNKQIELEKLRNDLEDLKQQVEDGE